MVLTDKVQNLNKEGGNNMKHAQIAYIPVGAPTFHLESAQEQFEQSIKSIKALTDNGVYPEKMLLTLPDLIEFLDTIDPSLIILQNITFANAAFASEVLKRFSCPVVLWTLREPVIDGGRLRLNSLTGAYSAANALHAFGNQRFEYIFGSPQEDEVKKLLSAAINASELKLKMRNMKLAAVGHTPQGFGFGRALDSELLQVFGVTMESIEARELIERAQGYTTEECAAYLEQAKRKTVGMERIPEQNQLDFARLYKAYDEYVKENNISALSSRCWPDFFTAFGTPVCSVLAMLNDNGTAASCEADVNGALSMYMGMQLTNRPVFFGDPVSLDEQESTITFWHCGTAACSLACKETGAEIGVHPNRKIGPAMDFGCEACKEVTVFRVGRKPDGSFRFFILDGEALDKPKQFTGTSVVVQTKRPAKEIVTQSVKEGFEPHFAVIYGNVSLELEMLANMLDLEVCKY